MFSSPDTQFINLQRSDFNYLSKFKKSSSCSWPPSFPENVVIIIVIAGFLNILNHFNLWIILGWGVDGEDCCDGVGSWSVAARMFHHFHPAGLGIDARARHCPLVAESAHHLMENQLMSCFFFPLSASVYLFVCKHLDEFLKHTCIGD